MGDLPMTQSPTPTRGLLRALKRDAKTIAGMLDIGDQRLLAGDGPANGRLPDLTPNEWGMVYRACLRIVKRLK